MTDKVQMTSMRETIASTLSLRPLLIQTYRNSGREEREMVPGETEKPTNHPAGFSDGEQMLVSARYLLLNTRYLLLAQYVMLTSFTPPRPAAMASV
jgi:hypothetical protein